MRKAIAILVVVVLCVGMYLWLRQPPALSTPLPFTSPLPAQPATAQPEAAQSAAAQPEAPQPVSSKPHEGVPGSATTVGCGDGLWQHVYHPQRLIVLNDCLTVTGMLVDATAPLKRHRVDGVRHEPDGDTHGWLKVDPEFADLINDGNRPDEDGNLVFEIVCHFRVTQKDAIAACEGFRDSQVLPPVGSRVAIKGSYVQDTNHGRWMEIHPVTSVTAIK